MISLASPSETKNTHWAIEWLAIVLIFASYAGQRPPDVNESHYLPKAYHFWDSSAAANDIFLASEPSHWLFYAATGWLTLWLPLEAFAWIGRLVTWSLLAAAWLRLARAVCPRVGFGLASATVALLLMDRGHLAGEWMVGGWEAKGIAYAIVLWAWSEWVLGNTRWLPAYFGAASAWHLLVGGWACLATLCQRGVRPALWSWPLAGGMLLIGVLPPLANLLVTQADIAHSSAQFQVRQRLAHHLYFPEFEIERVAAFSVVLFFWLIFYRLTRWHLPLQRIHHLAIATLVISWIGILLAAVANANGPASNFAYSLLRLYWFRISDMVLPIALALSICFVLWQGLLASRHPVRRKCGYFAIAVMSLAFGLLVWERHDDPRPRADQAALPTDVSDTKRTWQTFRNWQAVCAWVRENTPVDAVFLTPAEQQTFKWYAGRAEVCCWKDMPQDAPSLAKWQERLSLFYWPQLDYPGGLLAYSDEQLLAFAQQFSIDYLIVKQADLAESSTELSVVYPVDRSQKTTYAVIRLRNPIQQ